MGQGQQIFKASSGRMVKVQENGAVVFDHVNGYIAPEMVMDAEEFFQAKRDLDFGRWRSRLHPDFVVYDARPIRGGASDGIRVWNEREGVSRRYTDISGVDGKGATHDEVARVYFMAHPERKPWEDAEDEEIWALTFEIAGTSAWVRINDAWYLPGDELRAKLHPGFRITAGRRIWPEDAS